MSSTGCSLLNNFTENFFDSFEHFQGEEPILSLKRPKAPRKGKPCPLRFQNSMPETRLIPMEHGMDLLLECIHGEGLGKKMGSFFIDTPSRNDI